MTYIAIAILILLTFILGILFGIIGFAKLSTWSEKIYSKWDVDKSKMNIELSKNNVQTAKYNEQLEKSQVNAIGFSIQDEYDYEEYDDESKKKSNLKQRIGF